MRTSVSGAWRSEALCLNLAAVGTSRGQCLIIVRSVLSDKSQIVVYTVFCACLIEMTLNLLRSKKQYIVYMYFFDFILTCANKLSLKREQFKGNCTTHQC